MLEYAKKEGYKKEYTSGWRTFFLDNNEFSVGSAVSWFFYRSIYICTLIGPFEGDELLLSSNREKLPTTKMEMVAYCIDYNCHSLVDYSVFWINHA
ncbi:hypothetical protein J4421_00785 [Candidatus Woesearchaeota archaeon]|nr:hypothetical protein [Candidatus Woesearchaeota archaeon]